MKTKHIHQCKPKDNRVSEMSEVRGTVRHVNFGTPKQPIMVKTVTLAYPARHPMRKYRDAKRAAKQARQAKQK